MEKMVAKYVMAGVGFVMLAVNAVGYVFDTGVKSPALTVLGLVFVVIGLQIARKNKN
jgi:urea transporter